MDNHLKFSILTTSGELRGSSTPLRSGRNDEAAMREKELGGGGVIPTKPARHERARGGVCRPPQ
ncbi:MAG: hypothetical protein LBK47_10940 [Prevotellaceae bacterium]|nr:hypothetical protein [Prevotellaceae bacterium]